MKQTHELGHMIFSLALALLYVLIMATYWLGWRRLDAWKIPPDFSPKTPLTVVIPARNEAEKIGDCLRSILRGSYPTSLLEIIVVDDHSEDKTPRIVAQLAENQSVKIKLLLLKNYLHADEATNSFKKKAIEIAVAEASGTLIVTTDADCICPPDWLRLIASVFEKQQPKMLAAPVAFHREGNLLQRFQALDFAGMMGITGAGIRLGFQRMGNGANLSYSKSAFYEIGGFAGVDSRASGDDMFLLQKMATRFPDGIFFLKNNAATVLTEAKSDWHSFVQQRIRWGSKNAAYPEKWVTLLLACVFFFCWSILLNAAWLIFFFSKILASILAVQLALKAAADFVFLREMCLFFNRKDLLRWFLPSFFLHIFYIAVVGAASQFFKKYEWKGRRVR